MFLKCKIAFKGYWLPNTWIKMMSLIPTNLWYDFFSGMSSHVINFSWCYCLILDFLLRRIWVSLLHWRNFRKIFLKNKKRTEEAPLRLDPAVVGGCCVSLTMILVTNTWLWEKNPESYLPNLIYVTGYPNEHPCWFFECLLGSLLNDWSWSM